MAHYRQMPSRVDEAPSERTTPGQVLYWLRQILQYLAVIVLPFAHYDAKMGVLIADDAKRTILEGFEPEWLRELLNKLTGISSEKLGAGVLAYGERNLDNPEAGPVWVPIYEVIRDMLYGLFQTVTEDVPLRSPLYMVEFDDEAGQLRNMWIEEAVPTEDALKVGKPKILNVLASIASLLTISSRIPHAVVRTAYIDKVPAMIGVEVVGYEGSLADVEASKEMEIVTRLDQFRSSVPAKPGG
jgi:hypothetical protein